MLARSQTVHVVIVNFNGWRDTTECLESVLRSDYANLRVIVVDNSSTDDSPKRLKEWASGAWPYSPVRPASLSHLSMPPIAKPVDHLIVSADAIVETVGPNRNQLPALTVIAASANRGFAAG